VFEVLGGQVYAIQIPILAHVAHEVGELEGEGQGRKLAPALGRDAEQRREDAADGAGASLHVALEFVPGLHTHRLRVLAHRVEVEAQLAERQPVTAACVGQRHHHGVRVAPRAPERVSEHELPAIEGGPAGGGIRRTLRPVHDLVHHPYKGVDRVHGRPDLGRKPARGPVVGGIVAAVDAPTMAVELAEDRVGGSRHALYAQCPDRSPIIQQDGLMYRE
jgi:hypothetical protein